MSGTATTDRRLANRARPFGTLLVATIAALGVASPALAKMPYFTIEVDTTAPSQGEPITLTVRLFADAQHTSPTDWPDRALSGLLAIMPADGVAAEARSMPVPLKKIGPGTYVGSVVIHQAGRWILRTFPDRSGWGTSELAPGYPSDIVLQVAEPGPPLPVVAAIALALAGIAGLATIVFRRNLRRLDPQTGTAG
jgi:hypothetical protein